MLLGTPIGVLLVAAGGASFISGMWVSVAGFAAAVQTDPLPGLWACVEQAAGSQYGPRPSLLGRRQAVRHRILIPAYGGSNPPAPASNRHEVFATSAKSMVRPHGAETRWPDARGGCNGCQDKFRSGPARSRARVECARREASGMRKANIVKHAKASPAMWYAGR
jgi:hypothetical protein